MSTKPADFDQERQMMQRRVFSAVAHDLKTPLACIVGSLEIIEQMQDKLTSEQKNSLISSALAEAHRLDGFFNTMLETAKPK